MVLMELAPAGQLASPITIHFQLLKIFDATCQVSQCVTWCLITGTSAGVLNGPKPELIGGQPKQMGLSSRNNLIIVFVLPFQAFPPTPLMARFVSLSFPLARGHRLTRNTLNPLSSLELSAITESTTQKSLLIF